MNDLILLKNTYTFTVIDKDNNVVYKKTSHNLTMQKRYIAYNVDSLNIIIGTMTKKDEEQYFNNKTPISPNAQYSKAGKKLSPLTIDNGVYGTPIQLSSKSLSAPLSWECMNNLENSTPNSVTFHTKWEWGYHDYSNKLNSRQESKTDEVVEEKNNSDNSENEEFVTYGIPIYDVALAYDTKSFSVTLAHANVTDTKTGKTGYIVKRPTDKFLVEITLIFDISRQNSYINGSLFIPIANKLYGHDFNTINDCSKLIPQPFPSSIGFSNYPIQSVPGSPSCCYPLECLGSFNYSTLTSPIINSFQGECDKDEDLWQWNKAIDGEWIGFPIFRYIGTPLTFDVPYTLELKAIKDYDNDDPFSGVIIPSELCVQPVSDSWVCPGFYWTEWLAESKLFVDKNGRKFAVPKILGKWDLTITSHLSEEGPDTVEKRIVISDQKLPDRYEEVITVNPKTYRLYEYNLITQFCVVGKSEVKNPIYGNTYYNFNWLASKPIDTNYRGPARSLVFQGISAKKFEPREKKEIPDMTSGSNVTPDAVLLGGKTNSFGKITVQIGTGNGVTTRFYHPFITTGDWKSGRVVSAFSTTGERIINITHYNPTASNILSSNFEIIKDSKMISINNGLIVGSSVIEDNYINMGYHKKQKKSYFNLSPFDLKFYPVGNILGTNEIIRINQDLFREKTLHFVGDGQLRITRKRSDNSQITESCSINGNRMETESTYTFNNDSFDYTDITIALNTKNGYNAGGISYNFFEPTSCRISYNEIEGYVEFENPPPVGALIYVNVELLAPYFTDSTDFGGRFVHKLGAKGWNGGLGELGITGQMQYHNSGRKWLDIYKGDDEHQIAY